MIEIANHRHSVIPKNDYDIAKLWSFAHENGFMIFPSIQKYLEFTFIYPELIVDLGHKTIQMNGVEVVGGKGKPIDSVLDLIHLFNTIK